MRDQADYWRGVSGGRDLNDVGWEGGWQRWCVGGGRFGYRGSGCEVGVWDRGFMGHGEQ